ncbi:hypothetical protein [Collimonas sp. OK242]
MLGFNSTDQVLIRDVLLRHIGRY